MRTTDPLIAARYLVKRLSRPLIYRHAPIGLLPERLYTWCDALLATLEVSGDVIEVGCAAGGTAAWSNQLLRSQGSDKRYVCFDTFGGFVAPQFERDAGQGTAAKTRRDFATNSMGLVRRTLDGLGAREVELVKGDIVELGAESLPERLSAALLDVDLYIPIYAALEKVVPLLSPGGIVVVDDCAAGSNWKAADAYRDFCLSSGRTEEYRFGMGIVRGQADKSA